MAIAVAACACAALVPVVRSQSIPIVQPVPPGAASAGALSQVPPASRRAGLVRVDLYPLPTPGTAARGREDDLELTLFPDVTIRAVFDRFDTVGGSGTWVGHVANVPMSAVTLAYRDGLMTGSINTRDEVYMIQPLPESARAAGDTRPLHVVTEVDTSALPQGPDALTLPPDPGPAPPMPQPLSDSGNVVDLMVLYTPAAMEDGGGPEGIANQIALGVAQTNSAFANSGITTRIRLVHTLLMPYTERGVMQTSMDDMVQARGVFAGVEALRDARGADLVSLVVRYSPTTSGGVCGLGYLSVFPGQGARLGYSTIGNGACGIFVMAHELGHNFGAHHDWFVEDAPSPFPYGKGHVDLSRRWLTIMSYSAICQAHRVSCQTLPYFSNPDVTYIPFCSGRSFDCDLLRYWLWPQAVVGVADGRTDCRRGVVPAEPCAADNRRVLNSTASIVANYRQSR